MDRPAFDATLAAILDGRPFAEAVAGAYHADIHALWQRFVEAAAGQR